MGAKAIRAWAILAIASGAMAGCATPQPAPVEVVADSFCMAAKKRSWSVHDTQETIEEAVVHNAGIDRACGTPGKAAAKS